MPEIGKIAAIGKKCQKSEKCQILEKMEKNPPEIEIKCQKYEKLPE